MRLKALTVNQFLAELVVQLAACKPICMNLVARIALLAAMPTLDDVDITVVQRGDLSRGVVILGTSGLGSAAGSHGRGGGSVGGGPIGGRGGDRAGGGPTGGHGGGSTGDGPVGDRGGVPAGARGGGPAGGSSPALALDKGKEK
jgi:hypothetical protein